VSFLRIAAGLVLVLCVGCSEADPVRAMHDEEAAAYVRNLQRPAGDRAATVVELDELLPSTQLVDPRGSRSSPTTFLVVGRIEAVEIGRAFDQSQGHHREVGFSSPEADWRTLHLRLAVDERLGSPGAPSHLHLSLGIGLVDDVGQLVRGLPSLGRVLVPVVPGLGVYDHDPTLYGIAWDGELLGTVDDRGRIRFPWLEGGMGEQFLATTDTLAELREAASEPPRLIPVDATGSRIDHA
jgi:hypothetical protein